MKKITIMSVIFGLGITFAFAQEKNYVLNPDHSIFLIQNKLRYQPHTFLVQEKTLSSTTKVKVEQKTKAYKELEETIQNIEKDSVLLAQKHESQLFKYRQYKEITKAIEQFLISSKPFDFKKRSLIKAQNIAIDENLGYLIYADSKTNTKNFSKFLLLRKNALDLKVHLKKIVWDIQKKNKKPTFSSKEVLQKLSELKSQLQKTEKFETTLTSKTVNKKRRILSHRIDSELISGIFREEKLYDVMAYDYKSYLKNELVENNRINGYKIPRDFTQKLKAKRLITNIETGVSYLVEPNFLALLDYNKKEPTITQNEKKSPHQYKQETVAYSIEEYEEMIIQCKALTEKLQAHNQLSKNNTMSAHQAKEWRKDIIEAKILNNRIKKYSSVYKKKNYPIKEYINQETFKNYKNFDKTLKSSIQNIADF